MLPVLDFYIDEIGSDNHEEDAVTAVASIHELVKELGIDPIRWSDTFIEGKMENSFSGSNISRTEAIHGSRDGKGIGVYVTERAFDVLPIEHNEDGWGSVSISLAMGSEHVVILHTEGTLTMEDYSMPESDDDERPESEVDYTIRILADVCLRAS